MIDRRSALANVTATLGVAGLVRPAGAAPVEAVDLPSPLHGPRMNFAQADKVMTELGLDALVVGSGVNVYHATGFDLTSTRMGHGPAVFAIITRHEARRLSLVAPAFLFYYTIALDYAGQNYPVYVYTQPASDAFAAVEPPAASVAIFNDRGEAPLDAIEKSRAEIIKAVIAAQSERASSVFALRKALGDLGLIKGRIAVDLPKVHRVAAEAAPEATLVDADDALRRIRPVKSPLEITLMRQAARLNAEAALEAAQTVRAGGDVRDLRAAYFASVARRGGRGVFMVIDRVSAPAYEAKFRDGQCFSIDCVSEFAGYHGDYARAIYIGDPSANMKKVRDATAKAWDAVRATLKPGVSFSQIRATGRDTLKKMGVTYNISFTPHSVGLFHDDRDGSQGLPQPGDPVLQPGMTLSVDCPLLEAGAGGSSHLEDLTLITPDGSEQINDTGNRNIQV
jgi:Xaa-Pro aminopeptidase